MLGVSFLNEITASKKNLKSHIILNSLRDYVKNTLSQQGYEGETKDGMDISLVIFDFDANYAEFSGAYNSLYMIRKGELSEIKADKMPVGIYLKDNNSFTRHEIQLKKGDQFYMFSDGFPDQFGGEKGRKFMRKAFKKLLLDIHSKPMEEQKTMLDRTFKNWVGTQYHQTDDVIVIGVKI
jgi:serine phosphatase RsbU (regulator of sigma subunit)